MAYVLDIGVILIFGVCLLVGYCRGFIKSVGRVAAFIGAAIVALLLCETVAGFIFDSFVGPAVQDKVVEGLNSANTSLSQSVDNALHNLPEFITNALSNQGIKDGGDVLGQLSGGSQAPTAMAERITADVVRPVMISVIKGISFIVLFFVAMAILLVVVRLLDKIFKLPLLKGVNRTLGLLVGAITGVLFVLLAVSVVQVITASSGPDSLITPALIRETVLTRWLFSINPAAGAMQDLAGIVGRK